LRSTVSSTSFGARALAAPARSKSSAVGAEGTPSRLPPVVLALPLIGANFLKNKNTPSSDGSQGFLLALAFCYSAVIKSSFPQKADRSYKQFKQQQAMSSTHMLCFHLSIDVLPTPTNL
jgi:hypothetical protein